MDYSHKKDLVGLTKDHTKERVKKVIDFSRNKTKSLPSPAKQLKQSSFI